MAITLNDIKKMSTKSKVLIVIVVIFLIGYLDWFYLLSSAMDEKTSLNIKLVEMQGKIKEKEKIAMEINKYMADVAVLRENYKTALLKLPDQREIPALFQMQMLSFCYLNPRPRCPKYWKNKHPENQKQRHY